MYPQQGDLRLSRIYYYTRCRTIFNNVNHYFLCLLAYYTDILFPPGMHKYFAELSLKSSFLYTPTLPQRHTHSEGVVKDRSDIMLQGISTTCCYSRRHFFRTSGCIRPPHLVRLFERNEWVCKRVIRGVHNVNVYQF